MRTKLLTSTTLILVTSSSSSHSTQAAFRPRNYCRALVVDRRTIARSSLSPSSFGSLSGCSRLSSAAHNNRSASVPLFRSSRTTSSATSKTRSINSGWCRAATTSSRCFTQNGPNFNSNEGNVEEEEFPDAGLNAPTSTNNFSNNNNNNNNARFRKELLHAALLTLGLDANGLQAAVQQSLMDPTRGYDERFGAAAVRACRSFYYPKKKMADNDNDDLWRAAAIRTARQVEFLCKRHQAHQAAWVRHHDNNNDNNSNNDDTLPESKPRFPLVLILDNLRSAHNVGSLFRTADATNCALVLTVGIAPHPHGNGADKVQRAALGAELSVPTAHCATLAEALERVRQLHGPHAHAAHNNETPYTILGLETTAHSCWYTERQYPRGCGVALVLGNEVTGVDATMLSQLDGILEIPMFGEKNSLNVAACAPIVLYEILRQWNVATPSAAAAVLVDSQATEKV